MNPLKRIGRKLLHRVKQAWSLPQTIALAAEHRRRQAVLSEREAERIDRICNPSKYLGK